MAVEVQGTDIPTWIVSFGAALISAVSGFGLGLVNRGPAMQLAITGAVEPLLKGYKDRVDELLSEVHGLRKEVTSLRTALDDAKAELLVTKANPTVITGFGA